MKNHTKIIFAIYIVSIFFTTISVSAFNMGLLHIPLFRVNIGGISQGIFLTRVLGSFTNILVPLAAFLLVSFFKNEQFSKIKTLFILIIIAGVSQIFNFGLTNVHMAFGIDTFIRGGNLFHSLSVGTLFIIIYEKLNISQKPKSILFVYTIFVFIINILFFTRYVFPSPPEFIMVSFLAFIMYIAYESKNRVFLVGLIMLLPYTIGFIGLVDSLFIRVWLPWQSYVTMAIYIVISFAVAVAGVFLYMIISNLYKKNKCCYGSIRYMLLFVLCYPLHLVLLHTIFL